jgi:hypothetical protein
VEQAAFFLSETAHTKIVWNNIVKEFRKHGIGENRLQCLGYTSTREAHWLLQRVDIASIPSLTMERSLRWKRCG